MTDLGNEAANGPELYILEIRHVTKRYATTEVLSNVSLSVRAGEIHALVGENGAGKSTLLRVAAGFVHPDHGGVRVSGLELAHGNPRSSLKAGIAYVSQELTAISARSVLENVYLGTGRVRLGRLRRPDLIAEFQELARRVQSDLKPHMLVRSLSQAQRQELEIIRALARNPRILILDEPTAALDDERSQRVLSILKQLATDGIAIIFVSHRLDEVFAIADKISVLRDGRLAVSDRAEAFDEASLVRHMVGREISYLFPDIPEIAADAPVVFATQDLHAGPQVQGISLQVRRGEIVGLAGLIGAGRSEYAMAAMGAGMIEHGTVTVGLAPPFRPHAVRQMHRLGVVMIPEDRHGQGLVLHHSMADNMALGSMKNFMRVGGVISRRLIGETTDHWIRAADIRPPNRRAIVSTLSGGNQQKVLLAKWLDTRPHVLIVDEPTRGVDIGAKAQIHHMLVETAAQGVGVLLISSELEEVINLSHRILVFRAGRIVGEFAGREHNREAIMDLAFGVRSTASASATIPIKNHFEGSDR